MGPDPRVGSGGSGVGDFSDLGPIRRDLLGHGAAGTSDSRGSGRFRISCRHLRADGWGSAFPWRFRVCARCVDSPGNHAPDGRADLEEPVRGGRRTRPDPQSLEGSLDTMRDFKLMCPIPLDEARSPERLYHHFSVERDLAARLKSTSKKERAAAYPMVYEELFRRVPDHPSLTRAANPSVRKAYVMEQAAAMKQWLSPEAVYLEIGAGDAALASEVAKHVRRVYALEVSKT